MTAPAAKREAMKDSRAALFDLVDEIEPRLDRRDYSVAGGLPASFILRQMALLLRTLEARDFAAPTSPQERAALVAEATASGPAIDHFTAAARSLPRPRRMDFVSRSLPPRSRLGGLDHERRPL